MTFLTHFHFKGKQEQAATDPNPAIAVTAGAGSGKTLSLVGRYLHLLEQGYSLRSILAITFTEKTAREMRSRIRNAFSVPKELTAKTAKNAKENQLNLSELGVLRGSKNQVDLCVVGDSKQSIYRFRSADVTVFRQSRQTSATQAANRLTST